MLLKQQKSEEKHSSIANSIRTLSYYLNIPVIFGYVCKKSKYVHKD